LETVKALPSIFNNEAAISRARTVISRLAPRLIEMAIRDVDVNVRVHALSVITEIDKTGILEDDDEELRQRLVRLVFDHEAKVRKAVGGFVRGLWEQQREGLQAEVGNAKGNQKKRAAGINDADMEKWLGYKAIARLLHETASELDRPNEDPQSSLVARTTASAQAMTRATAGVEALWDSFEELQDWAELVEYLLQDHSEHDDLWLLSEAEESLMLQILVACIKRGSSVSLGVLRYSRVWLNLP
jgi:cohesin complex subunit SA-1/2